ncbi:DUF3784 domain-containing protein [Myroides sp. JBRI-B21084]|uniref:DUF3784 domain-containing protein n=1 Tax=Myroides sp. JBRI-B21084 TaxID=3119977 RepID=UPI0026E1BBBF|nr:DUF3784 domain-containing protein [Paenimyroides cloacae]WKW47421.1 DUF3784 domain-containing protein [Paenimyroides cloacae]
MYAGFIIAFILCFFASILNEDSAQSLLSGYNTMSDERKKKVNFKEIAKIHKKVFYGIALFLTLITLSNLFIKNDNFLFISFVLGLSWGFVPLFFLGKEFDKNVYKNWEKWLQRIALAFLFFCGLIISIIIYYTPLNELR